MITLIKNIFHKNKKQNKKQNNTNNDLNKRIKMEELEFLKSVCLFFSNESILMRRRDYADKFNFHYQKFDEYLHELKDSNFDKDKLNNDIIGGIK